MVENTYTELSSLFDQGYVITFAKSQKEERYYAAVKNTCFVHKECVCWGVTFEDLVTSLHSEEVCKELGNHEVEGVPLYIARYGYSKIAEDATIEIIGNTHDNQELLD